MDIYCSFWISRYLSVFRNWWISMASFWISTNLTSASTTRARLFVANNRCWTIGRYKHKLWINTRTHLGYVDIYDCSCLRRYLWMQNLCVDVYKRRAGKSFKISRHSFLCTPTTQGECTCRCAPCLFPSLHGVHEWNHS